MNELALLLVISLSMHGQPSPQAVAEKALAGQFGPLAAWQQEGYERIAAGRVVKKLAWVTHYSQFEPGCSTRTASGRRVEHGRTCAMLGAPFGTFVLLDLPSGMTLRQVWDRGSRRNLTRARKKGADTWVDLYKNTRDRRSLNETYIRHVWIAR
jgi:hypothetical protein